MQNGEGGEMSKGIYEFDLSNPEDEKEFLLMSKAKDIALAVMTLDENLRNEIKYQEHPTAMVDVYQHVRDLLHNALSDRGIDLDTLID